VMPIHRLTHPDLTNIPFVEISGMHESCGVPRQPRAFLQAATGQ
jgi:hypothetical protein